jgi:hypothetical protein
LTSLWLLVLNPLAAPTSVERRSALYLVAFGALASSIFATTVASTPPDVGEGASFWLLCLLALFTGAMALCTRRTQRVDPAADDRSTPSVHASPPDEGLSGFAAWRRTRVDKLSKFKLDFLPLAPTPTAAQAEGRRPADKRRKDVGGREHDPFARALEDHERRQK